MNDLFERATELFGTTERPSDSGYVLPNGALLNFSPFIKYINGIKAFGHDAVKVLFQEGLPPGGAAYKFTYAGAVRITENGIAISHDVQPTEEQYSFIERYCMTNNYFFVEFDTETDFLPETLYYSNPEPDKVIRDIRRHYDKN